MKNLHPSFLAFLIFSVGFGSGWVYRQMQILPSLQRIEAHAVQLEQALATAEDNMWRMQRLCDLQ